ncbi:shikimate dehydrogenase [Rhizobium helianthi]|uniref:Shikimate dehydrogenase (NADP(+)) n=1 Tax=Rhizobium helianthi TaxID=1132695 RepID=A0ABW4M707_9HYPH
MADSRETLRAFVVGHPISHSRSPLIHAHWLRGFGIDGEYIAIDRSEAEFTHFIEELKTSGRWRGGNVTIPHKEAAFKLADRPDDLAEELGAANTLWLEDGLLHATNTDGHGFTANLDQRAQGWDKTDRAVVLGAGGASRSIVQAIRNRGIGEIHVVNRTVERARELADRFGQQVHAHAMSALPEVMKGAGLFINTTSLGMKGEGSISIDFSPLVENAVVTDIVYVPLKTPMLLMAEQQGKRIVDGLGMLLHQAAPGFARWFGRQPTVDDTLRQMIIEDMERSK